MIVHTDNGTLEGVVDGGIQVFKGIPFAAPPVGALRWREPQPAASWEGTRKADTFGNVCLQLHNPDPALSAGSDTGPQSEDCLYLNVWTNGVDPHALKPVMVWIHGGAFRAGAGSLSIYSGIPEAKKGTVVVTINYRLGLLGFFAHAALEQENPGGPVNFGLLDQIAALKWVQRNIRAFGGNPDNVTIFGESAGAQSVLALFASPLARPAVPLFHKGIVESSYALPEHTRANAVALGATVATGLFGLDGARATAAELRAVPAEKFAETKMVNAQGATVQVPSLGPVPVAGDTVLPAGIRDTFAAGGQAPVPLIIGNNSGEASVLKSFGLDPATIMNALLEAGGMKAEIALAALKDMYRHDPDVSPAQLSDDSRFMSLVLTDLVFTMQTRWIADCQSSLAASRRYFFSYVTEASRPTQQDGVPHGGEIVYVFGTGNIYEDTPHAFTSNDWAMSGRVIDYWSSFAHTGTPEGVHRWPTNVDRKVLPADKTLKLGDTIDVADDFRNKRLDVYTAAYPAIAKKMLDGGW